MVEAHVFFVLALEGVALGWGSGGYMGFWFLEG